MTFFTAYKAVDVKIPIYFIESTAPNNDDDTDRISTDPLPHLWLVRLFIAFPTGDRVRFPV